MPLYQKRETFIFVLVYSPTFYARSPALGCARKKSELTDFERALLFGPQEKGSVQNFVLFILRAQYYVPCVQNVVHFILRALLFDVL